LEKDLRKPLCAGILRKWFLKRKTHLAVEDVFPKTAFEKLFFKKKLCRNLSKDIE
jgi:hypothetical protein